MFGRSKNNKQTKPRTNARGGLAQYGLFDVPDLDDLHQDASGGDDDEDDDSQLEAELAALTSGAAPAVRPKKSRVSPPKVNLDAMVAQSLRDFPSDEEPSGDEDDPELLAELGELEQEDDAAAPTATAAPAPQRPREDGGGNALLPLLEERLQMYRQAQKNAQDAGEASRARRFGRGISTLETMMRQARAGHVVNEAEIPPPVAVTVAKRQEPAAPDAPQTPACPAPSRPAPPPPPPPPPCDVTTPPPPATGENAEAVRVLTQRQNQYKAAALQAKRAGDKETAIAHIRVVKQFDIVLAAARQGEVLDLSDMPPPPPPPGAAPPVSVAAPPVVVTDAPSEDDRPQQQGSTPHQGGGVEDAPPSTPATVLEALEQRLDKYRSVEMAAKEEGNASKARRMGRIVKQYEDAIRLHNAGKPVPVDDLPTPPGFAPIPQEGGQPPPAPAAAPPPSPTPAPRPAAPPLASSPVATEKPNVRKSPQSRQEKQLSALLSRQKVFKEAALEAKRKGEVAQAKEYLRLAKGIDPLIEATHAGLPVDMDTVPMAPSAKESLESDFDIVNVDDCIPGGDSEIYDKLEEDLLKQAKMCLTTRDHFKAVGDVASANRFEQLALHSKKDLDTVRVARRREDPPPKFHYEMRSFSIVQCCTDLGDNDLELTVLRGISYNVTNPKDVDTYVKYEFPYPQEAPQKDRTAVVKDTNSPEYDHVAPLQIQRNVRACQRIFKRQSLKLEVWSRGGFFRGDTLLGTAQVKLQPLETKCVVHDSYDLLDGRKPVGGKLEVKLRLRNPIVAKQVEQIREKWLVVDGP